MSGAFNFSCQCTLVFGTSSGLSSWADFSVLGNISSEYVYFFVINIYGFIGAELAKLGARNISSSSTIAILAV
jgi:hypothetical protein